MSHETHTEQEQIIDTIELVKQVAEDKRRQAQASAALDRSRQRVRQRGRFVLIPPATIKGSPICF